MTALLLAVLALFAGPLLAAALRRNPAALYALDGFVLVAVSFLVLGSVLPEAVRAVGWPALVAAVLGFALPTLAERGWNKDHRGAHRIVLALSLCGLILHETLDGAGLAMAASGSTGASRATEWSIVLHRVPLGLFLWLSVRPLFGTRAAALALAAAAAATFGGYWAYSTVSPTEGSIPVALLLAFIGGALLHVLVHQVQPAAGRKPAPHAGAVGGALALLVLLPQDSYLSGLGDVLPLMLVVLWIPILAAGIFSAVSSAKPTPEHVLKRGGILAGLRLALTTPVCSCGIIPVYVDLVGHGVDGRTRLAFLLGAPVLRLEAFVLAGWLFGLRLAALWLGCALVLVVLCAWIFGRRWTIQPANVLLDGLDSGHAPERSATPRKGSWWSYFTGDWLDHNAAWTVIAIIFGLFAMAYLGAVGADPPTSLSAAEEVLALIGVMLITLPVYLHPFVALALAALPFFLIEAYSCGFLVLLAGPMSSVASRRVITRLHGHAASLVLTAALMAGTLACVLAVAPLLPDLVGIETAPASRVGGGLTQASTIVQVVAMVALLPALVSFWRCGPRGWLAEILPPEGHEHAHHPGVPHEHGTRARVQIDAAGD